MEYFLDESGCQKFLQLLADRPALELVEASQPLLHRLGVGSDVKGVLTTTIHSILDSGKLLAKARKLSGLSLYDSRLSYICCRNCSVRNLV